MTAYGCERGGRPEASLTLSEVSVVCTRAELDEMIEFLMQVRHETSGTEPEDGAHWHYRDWAETWSDAQSDLILFLAEGS